MKDEKTQDKLRGITDPSKPIHHCAVCGKSSPETICEHCKIAIQAEALSKKRETEKEK